MDQQEEQRYREFIAAHGQPVWEKLGDQGTATPHFAYFADGWSLEAGQEGFRIIPGDEARKREVKILYWHVTLENLVFAFKTRKEQLAWKAEFGTLTDEELDELRELQAHVQAATKQLSDIENPPGPDPKIIKRARKLYEQKEQLAADYWEYSAAYHEAETQSRGKGSKKLDELAQRLKEAYDHWEAANIKYQTVPEDVRREAERQVLEERRAARVQLQQLELDEIVI